MILYFFEYVNEGSAFSWNGVAGPVLTVGTCNWVFNTEAFSID